MFTKYIYMYEIIIETIYNNDFVTKITIQYLIIIYTRNITYKMYPVL